MPRKTKFLFCSVVVGLAISFGVQQFRASGHDDISLRLVLAKWLEITEVDSPLLDSMVRPPPLYADKRLDGKVSENHPRILLPELAHWSGEGVSPLILERLDSLRAQGIALDNYQPCGQAHTMSHVVCWLATGDAAEARSAIDLLLDIEPDMLNHGRTSLSSWEWALAYDLLSVSPEFESSERQHISAGLRLRLKAVLETLDGESASLWHGRSSLASEAWLLALALHGEVGVEASLIRRAQGHFLETINALALTEAWPEGYNYWINSRAILLVLAASGYVNGLEGALLSAKVSRAVSRASKWMVYATRPDDRIEMLGDEGPRIDLKDETRRVIDVAAQLTRDSVLASYSSYLDRLHSRASYYREYRWGFLLFHDPSVPLLKKVQPGHLEGLENYLPLADLFGPGAMNLFFVRSGWGARDTFISMRAGHTFTHHGHYDAGHFTIFKGAPLAINSSSYTGVFSPHRLYYGMRTVAKNSLLIVRPGDDIRPHKLIKKRSNEGGQRIVIPTGSRLRDVDHWASNLNAGLHLEGGEIQAYHFEPGDFAYTKTDLTGAYDSKRYDSLGKSGKVKAVYREMLYLFGEDRLLIRDKVLATEASFPKKWLLHTVNQPQVENSRVILGSETAGILESKTDLVTIENGEGRLAVKRILPSDATVRLVGGDGYKYYVDSDESVSSGATPPGTNFKEGAIEGAWSDNGAWRMEIIPGGARKAEEFLVSLSPSLGMDRSLEVERLSPLVGDASALVTVDSVIIFTSENRLDEFSFHWPGSQRRLLLVGFLSGHSFEISFDGKPLKNVGHSSGVLRVTIPTEVDRGGIVVIRRV